MLPKSLVSLISIFVSSVSYFRLNVAAHMLMSSPPPRGYRSNPNYQPVDYDLLSPLRSPIMCNGKPPGSPVQRFQAGQAVNVKFDGSARHGGGVCQFSLSYDNDRTFAVIEEIIGPCPQQGFEWPVQLPSNLPSCERCTFAWSWINSIGNREYYMDCADVKIIGQGRNRQIQGRPLMVANFPGYPTIFPRIHPGGGPGAAGTTLNRFPIQVVD